MDAKKIIQEIGGQKKAKEITGLTRARIWQWINENHIPNPWLKFFEAKYPFLNWSQLKD